MGLGGLTVSVHVSSRQRGADSSGLIETDTEKSAITPPPLLREGTEASHGTNGDYTNCQVTQRSPHLLYFIHPFINKTSVDGNLLISHASIRKCDLHEETF